MQMETFVGTHSDQNRLESNTLGRELFLSEGARWMSTQTIRLRLGSWCCRALILVQPGLLAATSCPFSVRRWRQREGDTETQRGEIEKGFVG